MLKRTITAIVGIALLVVACIYSHTIAFPILVGLMSLLGVYEMLGCVGMRKNFIVSLCLYVMTITVTVLTQTIKSHSLFIAAYSSFLFCIMLILLSVAVFSEGKVPVDKVCIAFTTCAYIITGFISIIQLRGLKTHNGMEIGALIYLLVFIAPWVTDTFAYFCGMLLGRHKLIPSVSPKKTVEGSIGGIVFCIAGCILYRYVLALLGNEALPPIWIFAVLGLIISIVSQIGDLIFSLIKRRYGIKDYGIIFPGHGGVLDRFDSVIATAPLMLISCEALCYFGIM
ncbi:MAG: phosphatidate cytidylyltransferase [Clostridia bacterium]|nr:phosphatidate cytidylyltransferase [Clostridia bacterium]